MGGWLGGDVCGGMCESGGVGVVMFGKMGGGEEGGREGDIYVDDLCGGECVWWVNG